jgi:hypothetical protein
LEMGSWELFAWADGLCLASRWITDVSHQRQLGHLFSLHFALFSLSLTFARSFLVLGGRQFAKARWTLTVTFCTVPKAAVPSVGKEGLCPFGLAFHTGWQSKMLQALKGEEKVLFHGILQNGA